MLSKESGYSKSTLQRYFYLQLDPLPVWQFQSYSSVHLLIDGTYFNKKLCLIVYRDDTIKFTQLYRLTNGEWYEELKEDLENILKLGITIESITCDGHKSLLKAIKKVCPEVKLQRCLVHIQRMCRIWLTLYPKSEAAKELKQLVGSLHDLNSHLQKEQWLARLFNWYERHKGYIEEKSHNSLTGRWWYKHKMLRRSYVVIKKALPNMFHYLDDKNIPKTTNGLESFFGHLKDNLSIHRGLSNKHRKNFIQWYLYFKNTNVF